MAEAIDSFTGDFEFLSNFHAPCWVVLDGERYISVEHAYQAAKTDDPLERARFQETDRPGVAKRMGRRLRLRRDWERAKVDVMRDLLRQKFAPGTDLARRLLSTGDAELIEGNDWGDSFWGKVRRRGEWAGRNQLGRLLMEIRDGLAAGSEP